MKVLILIFARAWGGEGVSQPENKIMNKAFNIRNWLICQIERNCYRMIDDDCFKAVFKVESF